MLNTDFSPLQSISWQRALCLSMIHQDVPESGVEVIEYYEDQVVYSAGGKAFPIPAVVKTVRYISRKRKIPITSQNVFARDKWCCQYCGKTLSDKNATIDHVISRHEWRVNKLKGHCTNWRNVVTSCKNCNRKKGCKSLDKCGLKLVKAPAEPPYNIYIANKLGGRSMPEQWRKYIYY